MDKRELQKKIAELLNVSEELRELAFTQFKKKLSESLSVGEAIKINSLGVFQVKEQIDRSEDHNKISSRDKSITLVFSPESRYSEDDSVFLNLELDDKLLDDNEFDENVFQIGIDKPLLTSKLDEDESDVTKKRIIDSVYALINSSERIDNFDLWEDHLKSKETKEVINDPEDNFEDSSLKDIEKVVNEKDFEGLDENEIFDGIIDESDLISEEDLDEIINEDDEINYDEDENLLEDLEKVTEDFVSEHEDSLDQESSVTNEIDELIEDKKPNENFIDEVELELKEENFGEPSDIQEDTIESNIADTPEEIKSEFETTENESLLNSALDIEEDPREKSAAKIRDLKYKDKRKKKSPVLFFLIAAILAIAASAIYYIFFNKHEPQEYKTEMALTENDEEIPVDTQIETKAEAAPDVQINAGENENIDAENTNDESQSNNLGAINEEQEVSENIYFDGFVYNVQISSWKQRNVADRESQKLIDKGFPAFVVKVYIPKFDGDWHRVRIGPYPSLKAAKQAQEELKK